jgi:uncharacterized protein (DUF1697 family)
VTRYVALLRGIAPVDPRMRNVRLREVCEALGLRNVATVVSSGNVIFDADATDPGVLEEELETAWPQRLGFDSTSIVRTYEQLVALREMAPFGDREHGKGTYLLVTFLKHRIDPSPTTSTAPLGPGFEVVATTDGELFSVTDTTTSRTPDAMTWLEREFGKTITSRTWLTITRIVDRCERGTTDRAER